VVSHLSRKSPAGRRGRPPHPDVLTPAEWSIAHGVRHGISDRGIARLRGISRDAVRFHVANIKAKLGLRTRGQIRQWRGIPADSPLSSTSREQHVMTDVTLGPIGQVARGVKDIGDAERFYRDVLGLKHLFTAGKLAFFDCGGVRLMLEDRSIIEAAGLHNDSVLYFRVPDIHAAQDALTNRGVTFKGAPHMIYRHPDGTEEWMTFFEEPGGGILSLMSQVKRAD
jgi:DNA-binding CsgD family transcriptional regulator/catechol 2,3-dioxygenase-like lactoylglutathione lyase family enzyme